MSRIGRMAIPLPSGVSFSMANGSVQVTGPKGSLSCAVVPLVQVANNSGVVQVSRQGDDRVARSNHGLMRALINNMVVGVSKGFSKSLEVVGIGYRAEIKGKQLVMQLGYSHLIEYDFPPGIHIEVDKKGVIHVHGADKQQVGQVAAVIRGFRPPDRYKGKGVRYVGEYVSLKAGKSA